MSGDALLAEAEALVDEGRSLDAIEVLTAADRRHPDAAVAARAVRLRHDAFTDLSHDPPPDAPAPLRAGEWPGPELPEYTPAELTPELYCEAMTRHGCVLVRGLVDEATAADLRAGIDRALDAFDTAMDGEAGPDPAGYFRPFRARPEHGKLGVRRRFMRDTGSVWMVDSPRMFATVLELLETTGIKALVEAILQERPTLSANKFNLRRVPAQVPTNWHQDGAFLGADTRSVNLWLALSDCGVDAPGLDIVPRRIDEVVETGSHGAAFDWSVAPDVVERAAGEAGITRPRFGVGDALLFDHLFLHSTAVSEAMTQPRYAIESWFFTPSRFPDGQIPVVL